SEGSAALAVPSEPAAAEQAADVTQPGVPVPQTEAAREEAAKAADAPADAKPAEARPAEPALQLAPAPAAADPMATMKIRATQPSLAANVRDAAAAQLLLFDLLPDDE